MTDPTAVRRPVTITVPVAPVPPRPSFTALAAPAFAQG
jgi:hypothetical protein